MTFSMLQQINNVDKYKVVRFMDHLLQIKPCFLNLMLLLVNWKTCLSFNLVSVKGASWRCKKIYNILCLPTAIISGLEINASVKILSFRQPLSDRNGVQDLNIPIPITGQQLRILLLILSLPRDRVSQGFTKDRQQHQWRTDVRFDVEMEFNVIE